MGSLIQRLEGYVGYPYYCSANKVTFGYGHRILATDIICGVPASEIYSYAQSLNPNLKTAIKNKMLAQKFDFDPELAQKTANRLYAKDVTIAHKAISKLVKVPLNANQLEALTSFVFNLGSGNLSQSTLLKKLNIGDYKGASQELLRWNRETVGGKKVVSKGLTNRREAEVRLFNEPIKKVG